MTSVWLFLLKGNYSYLSFNTWHIIFMFKSQHFPPTLGTFTTFSISWKVNWISLNIDNKVSFKEVMKDPECALYMEYKTPRRYFGLEEKKMLIMEEYKDYESRC